MKHQRQAVLLNINQEVSKLNKVEKFSGKYFLPKPALDEFLKKNL
jgi:hypothetical protein